YSKEWDDIRPDQNIITQVVEIGTARVTHPLMLLFNHLMERIYNIAETHIPPEEWDEYYNCWRWADDLQTPLDKLTTSVAAGIARNIPHDLTTLEEALDSAMTKMGLCCEGSADMVISDDRHWHFLAKKRGIQSRSW
ncbi:MAG: hypothetical protein O7E55_09335, partial [Chloroflexi bacterium]|nr:hypothetical protein [Chloroflexota bacterium]